MMRFLIVFEKGSKNFSAYCPDLPGCVATGATRVKARSNMIAAIRMHVRGLTDDQLPIPESSTFAEFVSVSVDGAETGAMTIGPKDPPRSPSDCFHNNLFFRFGNNAVN